MILQFETPIGGKAYVDFNHVSDIHDNEHMPNQVIINKINGTSVTVKGTAYSIFNTYFSIKGTFNG